MEDKSPHEIAVSFSLSALVLLWFMAIIFVLLIGGIHSDTATIRDGVATLVARTETAR